MNDSVKKITKNASIMMLSQLITWGMALVLMIFLPRYLGAVGVGKFQLAGSLWAIVSIVVGFGMDTYMTKEIARTPEKTNQFFSASIILRVLMFLFGVGGMVIYTRLAGYPSDTVFVIVIIGVAAFIDQLALSCRSILNGLERMEYVSLSDIAAKAAITLVSIVLLVLGYGVTAVAIVSILGSLIGFITLITALRRVQQLKFEMFDRALSREILKASFPFLILNGFLVFYAQVDIIIISLLVSEEALGWYGAADRLFNTLLFIPTVFMTAVFPSLSRLHLQGSEKMAGLSRLSFNLLFLAAVPIGFGLIAISDPLIALIFGPDFRESAPILQVFGIVLIFTYQNILVGSFLISSDRQNPWTKVIIIAALLSIPLDLILVPWCQATFNNGAIGGTIAFVITEAFMLAGGIYLLPKGTLGWSNFSYAVRTVVAGGVMLTAVWGLRNYFLLIPIAVGAVVYAVCAVVFRLISPEIWQALKFTSKGILNKLGTKHIQPVGSNTTE